MSNFLLWILKFTKLQKVIDWLEGSKQKYASLGVALVGTGTIVANFSELGMPYLLHVASTPEFIAASGGWVGFFNSLKGEKTRAEIRALNEKLGASAAPSVAP